MRFVRALLLIVALIPSLVQAASVPAYSPAFGQAMAGVAAQKATNRGFAANDPRFAATTSAIGAALTAAAAALVGAAGLPIWASVVVSAATAVAVSLAANSIYKWIWNPDGTISTTGLAASDPAGSSYGAMTAGGQYWSAFGYQGGSPESAFYAWFRNPSSGQCGGGDCAPNQYGDYVQRKVGQVTSVYQSEKFEILTNVHYADGTNSGWSTLSYVTPSYSGSGAVQSCASGSYSYNGGACTVIPMAATNTPTSANITNGTVSQAVNNIPASELTKPVNPQLLADAINKRWQAASLQPGYMGLPYDAANPVTVSDVVNWQNANPSSYPTVSDLIAPAVNPSTSTVPFAPPGVQTTPQGTQYPGINSAPEGSTKVDLGYDPAIPLPTLESTPSGSDIFKPISDGVSPWLSFSLPGHSSACPTASFTWWGRAHVMDAHCTLIANSQSTITAAMYAFWVIAALFIILGA